MAWYKELEISKDLQLWNGGNKLSVPRPNVRELVRKLRAQIPRQQNDVIWLLGLDTVFADNFNSATRQKLTLLRRATIHHPRNQIVANAGKIQKSISFGGS